MIAFASDHAGLSLKKVLIAYAEELKLEYRDYGTYTEERCDYPDYAYRAAQAVASGECDRGVIVCGTGVGISIAANKLKGIRCVVCSEPYSAILSRNHNNTNMLSLGSRVVGTELAKLIFKSWLDSSYEGGRHQRRLDKISDIEAGRSPLGEDGCRHV